MMELSISLMQFFMVLFPELSSCQVRVGESVNSLMVPSRAIHPQNGRNGVVLHTEGGDYWTGVEVVSDDGSTAYVIPDNPAVLYEGVPVRLFR